MKFIIVFGPPAVGKMTVGQELEKLTGFKLFHNHMTIELVKPFFDLASPSFGKLVNLFRIEMLKEIAKSNLPGLIFTCGWVLNDTYSTNFIDTIVKIFERKKAEIFFAELEADIETRLQRNKTANRLKYKPSKRDIILSESKLLEFEKSCRFNTTKNEFTRENYVKINNAKLSAKKVAKMIQMEFNF